MDKIKKIGIIILICMLSLTSFAFADTFWEAGDAGADIIIGKVDADASPFVFVQSLIVYIGVITAVVVVLVYGIQWIMATPAKKQQLKAALVPLIIGVILLAIGPKLTISIVETLVSFT